MARSDLDKAFGRIDKLFSEINVFAPATVLPAAEFRADLAGLLVVSIVSTYENCVKEIMIDFAASHHPEFGGFAERNFEKLNSKIGVDDLRRYCGTFGLVHKNRFNEIFGRKKKCLYDRAGLNIEASYKQMLDWRHDFAHAGLRKTTIEEAAKTHKIAKRVIYCFDATLS